MNATRQTAESERNSDAFVRTLARALAEHRDRLAGMDRFPQGILAIQEVPDQSIHLGFWPHAGNRMT